MCCAVPARQGRGRPVSSTTWRGPRPGRPPGPETRITICSTREYRRSRSVGCGIAHGLSRLRERQARLRTTGRACPPVEPAETASALKAAEKANRQDRKLCMTLKGGTRRIHRCPPCATGCLPVGRAHRARWLRQAGAAVDLGRLRVLAYGHGRCGPRRRASGRSIHTKRHQG